MGVVVVQIVAQHCTALRHYNFEVLHKAAPVSPTNDDERPYLPRLVHAAFNSEFAAADPFA